MRGGGDGVLSCLGSRIDGSHGESHSGWVGGCVLCAVVKKKIKKIYITVLQGVKDVLSKCNKIHLATPILK